MGTGGVDDLLHGDGQGRGQRGGRCRLAGRHITPLHVKTVIVTVRSTI
ncbi:hypothetical protein [Streptomyces pseudogriseolus]